jgi:hypothetical protein
MAPYRIALLAGDGTVHDERVIECAYDDEVIDHVGRSDHPHEIDVWQGQRHVARFPPWPPPRATSHRRFRSSGW